MLKEPDKTLLDKPLTGRRASGHVAARYRSARGFGGAVLHGLLLSLVLWLL